MIQYYNKKNIYYTWTLKLTISINSKKFRNQITSKKNLREYFYAGKNVIICSPNTFDLIKKYDIFFIDGIDCINIFI